MLNSIPADRVRSHVNDTPGTKSNEQTPESINESTGK